MVTELDRPALPKGAANCHAFNSERFASLNGAKARRVSFLAVGEKKPKLWLTAGLRDGEWRSPFSAPYGGWAGMPDVSQRAMCDAARDLRQWAEERGEPLRVGLPPLVYDETFLTKSLYALRREGRVALMQPDYYFLLSDFADYEAHMSSAARNKLANAARHPFLFEAFPKAGADELARAYAVVERNRAERGYPLAMSLEAVEATSRIMPIDAFTLSLEGNDAAAALVFRVLPDVGLVVYWGNTAESNDIRAMNMLAYKVFEHYHREGRLRLLDIGPSDLDGEPNLGLMEFKESIGCRVSPRFTILLGETE